MLDGIKLMLWLDRIMEVIAGFQRSTYTLSQSLSLVMKVKENQIYTLLIRVYCIYNISDCERANVSRLFAQWLHYLISINLRILV